MQGAGANLGMVWTPQYGVECNWGRFPQGDGVFLIEKLFSKRGTPEYLAWANQFSSQLRNRWIVSDGNFHSRQAPDIEIVTSHEYIIAKRHAIEYSIV